MTSNVVLQTVFREHTRSSAISGVGCEKNPSSGLSVFEKSLCTFGHISMSHFIHLY